MDKGEYKHILRLVEDCSSRSGGCEQCPLSVECVKQYDRLCDKCSLTKYYKTDLRPYVKKLEEVLNA